MWLYTNIKSISYETQKNCTLYQLAHKKKEQIFETQKRKTEMRIIRYNLVANQEYVTSKSMLVDTALALNSFHCGGNANS